ncbi:HAD family hydrolase [Candidatus Aerophobetes bacterium]|nr:HAD family hydrolase [Candidatus Aerophobetes bacterium]
MKKKIEAVIFDLNGVIIKSIARKLDGINKIFNVDLSQEGLYSIFYPVYMEASLGRISVQEFWQKIAKRLSSGYVVTGREDDVFLGQIELKENDVSDILSSLKRRYKLGLLSNFIKEWAYNLLERFKLSEYFDGILISSEIGERKPHLMLYLKICEALKVELEKSAYIADEEEDLVVPEKIGMLPVFIPGEAFSSKVGITIKSLKELENIL